MNEADPTGAGGPGRSRDPGHDRDLNDDPDLNDDRDLNGDGELFSDAELTELALAADPEAAFDADAEPFGVGDRGAALLPEWYMPVTLRADAFGGSRRRRVWTVAGIVAALLVVNGAGLCVTYGFPEIAW